MDLKLLFLITLKHTHILELLVLKKNEREFGVIEMEKTKANVKSNEEGEKCPPKVR